MNCVWVLNEICRIWLTTVIDITLGIWHCSSLSRPVALILLESLLCKNVKIVTIKLVKSYQDSRFWYLAAFIIRKHHLTDLAQTANRNVEMVLLGHGMRCRTDQKDTRTEGKRAVVITHSTLWEFLNQGPPFNALFSLPISFCIKRGKS